MRRHQKENVRQRGMEQRCVGRQYVPAVGRLKDLTKNDVEIRKAPPLQSLRKIMILRRVARVKTAH